jgi:phosphoenolpyruvate phosphomutase
MDRFDVSKAGILRELLHDAPLVRLAGAHDALGAKLVEATGFEGVWASSFELSAANCLPDLSLLSMTQYLQAAVAMNDAVSIPVVADCDSGFGGPLNVAHLVRQYERRGVAAVCIEDQVFPKVNSLAAVEHHLLPAEEFAHRIAVGKRVQQTKEFVVIARTEALVAGESVDEALHRARTYVDAGADAVLVHSNAASPAPVLEFAERWQSVVPIVIVPTTYPTLTAAEIQRAGIRMVIYANHGLRAAVRAMADALREMWEAGTSMPIEDRIASVDEIFGLEGMSSWLEIQE